MNFDVPQERSNLVVDVDSTSDQQADGEATRLSQALASQLDIQIARLTKIRQTKVESLLKVKAGPAEVTDAS